MAGIYPDWLGNIGGGQVIIKTVYVEVPCSDGIGRTELIKQITVRAKVLINNKKKKIKIKVKLI